jgi:hypothetical protein
MKPGFTITLLLVATILGCSSEKSTPKAISQDDSPSASSTTSQSPYEIGKREANTVIAQGKLCWKLCGQPAAHDNLFKQVLKEEYKVGLLVVAGCNVPNELQQNVKGYNEIMKAEILKRFKKNVIPLAEERAKQQFEDQRKK